MNKQNNAPKCPKCGHEMRLSKVPHVWRRKIPFMDAEIQIVRWVDEWYCPFCAVDEESERMNEMLAGAEDYGYRMGYRDAMEER